jgi:hypothetical protein
MGEKFCRDCGQNRPLAEFAKNKTSSDGLAFYCRSHSRLRSRASRDRRLGPPTNRVARGIQVPDGCKWCPDCGAVKPLVEFPRAKAATSGRHTYCRACHNARGKASLEKLGGSRTYHLKRRYGISAAEADLMLEAQHGLCAICGEAPAAHVDHDHETGAVRALLCFNCNGGLGQFHDDPGTLRAAADYVEQHRDDPAERTGSLDGTSPATRRATSPGMARWRALQASPPAPVRPPAHW